MILNQQYLQPAVFHRRPKGVQRTESSQADRSLKKSDEADGALHEEVDRLVQEFMR